MQAKGLAAQRANGNPSERMTEGDLRTYLSMLSPQEGGPKPMSEAQKGVEKAVHLAAQAAQAASGKR